MTLQLYAVSEKCSVYHVLSLRLFYEARTTDTSYEFHNRQIQVPFMAESLGIQLPTTRRRLFELAVLSASTGDIDLSTYFFVIFPILFYTLQKTNRNKYHKLIFILLTIFIYYYKKKCQYFHFFYLTHIINKTNSRFFYN